MNNASDKGEYREQQHCSYRDQNSIEQILSPRAEKVKLQHSLTKTDDDNSEYCKQRCEECGGSNIDECIQHFLAGGEVVQAILIG